MEVTQVFDSSHCLLPLVKDKMFRKVDLLTSEGKTKQQKKFSMCFVWSTA